jgi:hypothetical protein
MALTDPLDPCEPTDDRPRCVDCDVVLLATDPDDTDRCRLCYENWESGQDEDFSGEDWAGGIAENH